MGDQEAPLSPKNKVKFLCSHGGRILPRPSDGQLKYVGGETRVVSVSRNISFSELKEKLTSMFEGNMVLKYQLIPDELDALVSVTCEEDLKHMFEEYDRQEAKALSSTSSSSSPSSGCSSSPRLRAFLFPPTPFIISDHHHHSAVSTSHINTNDASAMEQRYLDAINGIMRVPGLAATAAPTTSNTGVGGRPIFSISSAGSSPKSIIAPADAPFAADSIHQDTAAVALCDKMGNIPSTRTFGGNHDTTTVVLCENISSNPPPSRTFGAHRSFSMHDMHKVQSSPSLLNLSQQQQQQQKHQNQLHHHHHYHHYQQQSSRHPRVPATAPMAAPIDAGACQLGSHCRYYPSASHQRMTGGCSGYGHVDGWKPYRTGSGFLPDPENAPQCSTRQMGAEGHRRNHGLVDYRER